MPRQWGDADAVRGVGIGSVYRSGRSSAVLFKQESRHEIREFPSSRGREVRLLDGDHIIDVKEVLSTGSLSEPDAAAIASMNALNRIRRTRQGPRRIRAGKEQGQRAGRLPTPRLGSTCLTVRALSWPSGGNYSDHRDEKDEAPLAGRETEFFFKTPHTVVAHGDPLEIDPRVTSKLDYEVELAVVIGKKGRQHIMESVPDHIFGYTILNDVTARERQVRYKTDGTMFYEAGLEQELRQFDADRTLHRHDR